SCIASRSAASFGEMMLTWFLINSSSRLVLLSGSLKDGLWLKKRLNSVDAKFATHAGLFESAERCLLVVYQAIDRNPAGLDLRCDSTGALNVSPTHVSVEAVLRIVGDPDCILFVLVGDN